MRVCMCVRMCAYMCVYVVYVVWHQRTANTLLHPSAPGGSGAHVAHSFTAPFGTLGGPLFAVSDLRFLSTLSFMPALLLPVFPITVYILALLSHSERSVGPVASSACFQVLPRVYSLPHPCSWAQWQRPACTDDSVALPTSE